MKKKLTLLIIVLATIFSYSTNAQESSWSTGVDLYSSYVWRGTKFGSGPALQPCIEFSAGGFSIGAWGSYCFSKEEAMEADLYASYGFDFGLSIGVTDYYFPGTEYFDYSTETGAHGFELNLGYEIKGLSLAANYMLNEAGGAATAGGDMYFEVGYSFKSVNLFAGAGDGWHTPDGDFGLVNVGIGASKEIKITDSFSLPISGSAILNPTTEQFHIVVGISL